ncbi:MAG TPA: HAD-IA family hydrolase [Planctomycetota bacterium]|nr:HAD-IA family hydrolase [Planctomycetota bacterium]
MTASPFRAVIFDMDGTLTRPFLDFPKIRASIGVAEPLLENMLALPPGPDRDRAFAILDRFEDEAAEASELNDGTREVLAFLETRSIPSAVVTRNSRRSTLRVLSKHGLRFELCVTRDDAPAKPRPEPLWLICERLGVPPAEALMVGDFKFDILAGRNAGTRTALLTHGKTPSYLKEIPPDHLLERLEDLLRLFQAT